MTKPSPMLHTT